MALALGSNWNPVIAAKVFNEPAAAQDLSENGTVDLIN